jgi:hypothetical protein
MKRLILLSCMCIAGFVAVPVTSANAELIGTCTLKGNATLTPALGAVPSNAAFSFTGTGGSCNGVNQNNEPQTNVAVEESFVSGEGKLSCTVSQNVVELQGKIAGSGRIKVQGKTDEFGFKLVGVGPNVSFATTGSVTSAGVATFATNAGSIKACSEFSAGSLAFEAAATGSFK